MRLKITHRTEYRYDAPVQYALQRLRLVPRGGTTQTVHTWSLKVEGASEEVRFVDHFGNDTRLVSIEGEPRRRSASRPGGEVETFDTAGVIGAHQRFCAALAVPARDAADRARRGDPRSWPLRSGRAPISTGCTADGRDRRAQGRPIRWRDAAQRRPTRPRRPRKRSEAGPGVCQDHAHIFIAAARLLGFPARYVSGYLMMNDTVDQAASHAWAEAHVDGLGWVAFDAANGISPDERYVRMAAGRDYRDAMPVSGIRLGQAEEQLAVRITVEQ